MRVRGLKQPVILRIGVHRVAPHAGAWIETHWVWCSKHSIFVAPHAGAWIETGNPGLNFNPAVVAPHAGAWIETSSITAMRLSGWSHPMRVRGLKPAHSATCTSPLGSHPMRVRGLKQPLGAFAQYLNRVAPHAGAWIETNLITWYIIRNASRTPCGCVD